MRAVARWDDLLADLSAQAEAEESAERDAEVADLVRAEHADVGIADRLRAHEGLLGLALADGSSLRGSVIDVGKDCLTLSDDGGGQALVPFRGVSGFEFLGTAARQPESLVAQRLGFNAAMRRLARAHAPVRIGLTSGTQRIGALDRVGRDHIDVLADGFSDPDATPRRAMTIPLDAIVVVRRIAQ